VRNLICLLTVASIALVSELIYANPVVFAENVDRYWTVLDGDQQILPNNTNARGFVGLKFQEDMSRLVYNVNVDNIDNITGVYLYHGNENQNGTMVLDLLEEAKEVKSDDVNIMSVTRSGGMEGALCTGGVTAGDLQGQLKDKSLSDLHNSMVDGSVYVTVNTKDFPNGGISGNSFVAIDRVFPDLSVFRWN